MTEYFYGYERCGACRDLGGEHTLANDCRFRHESQDVAKGDES